MSPFQVLAFAITVVYTQGGGGGGGGDGRYDTIYNECNTCSDDLPLWAWMLTFVFSSLDFLCFFCVSLLSSESVQKLVVDGKQECLASLIF
jgi:hypothetical protein